MNIWINTQITLSAEDIQAAVSQYITDNGFDLEGKEVKFSTELPESIQVTVDSVAEPAETKPVAKPKARAKPKAAVVAEVEQPEPELETHHTVSLTLDTPVAEDNVFEPQDIDEELEYTELAGQSNLDAKPQEVPVTPAFNPFAKEPEEVKPVSASIAADSINSRSIFK